LSPDAKTCPKCGQMRPLSEFALDRSKASGRKSHCRDCDRAKSRAYYVANRERKLDKLEAQRRAAGIPPRGSSRWPFYRPRDES
jgi:hypothetical protein